MAESNWHIRNGDVKIYGVLNKSRKRTNKRAILFVHGVTGHAHEYVPSVMASQFPDKGYDIIRIFLYHWEESARKISDTTLAIHGQDITKVVQHFSKKYEQIFACGHSYGVPSLLFSKTNLFAGLAFWDGTIVPANSSWADPEKNDFIRIKGGYVFNWGVEYFIGDAMINEAHTLDVGAMKKLSQKVKIPTLVVEAANGTLIKYPEKYMDWLTCEKKNIVIQNTIHCFHEEGAVQPLLRATKAWFDRF